MGKRDWPRCSEPECDTAVREIVGDYRGPRQPEPDGKCARHKVVDTEYAPPPAPVPTDDLDSEEQVALDDSPAAVERVASLRAALRDGLMTEEVAQLVRDQVIEALRAVKKSWTTCGNCHHRVPVTIPDAGTRLNAAMRLMEELEGKMRASWEAREETIGEEATKLLRNREALSDDELSRLIVSLERELADDA